MLYNICQPVRLHSSSHQEAAINLKYCFEKQNFRGDQAKEFCTMFCFNCRNVAILHGGRGA